MKMEEALTARDFQDAPVWGFRATEDGEPPVEPRAAAGISFDSPGAYLVAATATLADGRECSGFVQLGRTLSFVEAGPLTLFVDGRQCLVEASIPGWAGTRAVSAAERRMLPIRWTAAVCVAGEPRPRAGSVSPSRLVHFLRSTLRGLRIQGAVS